jgi:hypothetical protein
MEGRTMAIRIKPELLISAAAFILSIVATISSIYFSRVGLRTTVLPSLVFVYDSEKAWSLRNVGNGPALNITVAHTLHGSSDWLQPTRLYPLSEGEDVSLRWVGYYPDKLGVVYSDAHNRQYTSVCDEDLTEILSGRALPSWKPHEIRRVWERTSVVPSNKAE